MHMNLFKNDDRIVLANFVGVGRWKEKLFKMFTLFWDNPRIGIVAQVFCSSSCLLKKATLNKAHLYLTSSELCTQ